MGVDAEMFIKTRKALSESDVLQLSHEIASAFGSDRFWIWRDNGRHALSVESVYEQDGPDIIPLPGETFVRAHIATRFYGVGYERGDLPLIIMVAKWLEDKIGGEVWYGGDSSGECATLFDERAREELWGHFLINAHDPYVRYFGHGKVPTCEFCQAPMIEYSWAGNTIGFYCSSCDYEAETSDGGRTYQEKKKKS